MSSPEIAKRFRGYNPGDASHLSGPPLGRNCRYHGLCPWGSTYETGWFVDLAQPGTGGNQRVLKRTTAASPDTSAAKSSAAWLEADRGAGLGAASGLAQGSRGIRRPAPQPQWTDSRAHSRGFATYRRQPLPVRREPSSLCPRSLNGLNDICKAGKTPSNLLRSAGNRKRLNIDLFTRARPLTANLSISR